MSRVILCFALLFITAAMPVAPEPSPMMDLTFTPQPFALPEVTPGSLAVTPNPLDAPVIEPSVPPTNVDLPLTAPPRGFGVQNATGVFETPVPLETTLTKPLTVGVASPAPLPPVVPLAAAPNSSTVPKNEGCVAVEHLSGFVLQHPVHLSRQVLCTVIDGMDFCATPNHAIILDGTMTSMKKICTPHHKNQRCVTSVKLENNLKITANRRAVISDRIVVTPYDMRFPKIAVWAVQILEEIFTVQALATIVVGIATTGLVSLRKKGSVKQYNN